MTPDQIIAAGQANRVAALDFNLRSFHERFARNSALNRERHQLVRESCRADVKPARLTVIRERLEAIAAEQYGLL